MVKNLIVPERYAKKKVEDKVEDKKSELQVSDAYVKEEDRVLDPKLLKKSAKQILITLPARIDLEVGIEKKNQNSKDIGQIINSINNISGIC